MAADVADYETIMTALRNADAAGDTEAATRLAQMAREAKGAQPVSPQPAKPDMREWMMQRAGEARDAGTAADANAASWLNRAGESMTFGLVGDEAAAKADELIGRGTYDDRLAQYRQKEQNLGTVGRVSADLAGAALPALTGAGLIGQAGNWGSRALIGAGLGGLGGGTYGFMEGEGDATSRAKNARAQGIIGALLGGAIPVAGAGAKSIATSRAARSAVKSAAKGAPSSEALRAEGTSLYRQIDDAGVQIKADAVEDARKQIVDALLDNTAYSTRPGGQKITPNTAAVMDDFAAMTGEMAAAGNNPALPFRELDHLRRQAGAAAGNVASKSDQKAGMTIIEGLDNFVQRLGPDDVVGGDVKALQSAIGKARDVWSRMSKSQMVDDAIAAGEDYLSGTASGIRNQFKNILRNKKLAKGFTEAEKAALRQVTHGSTLDQLINLAGGGLAQLGAIGGGFHFGGIGGGLLGTAAAAGQRKLAEAVTTRAAETARAAIASGKLGTPEIAGLLANSGRQAEKLTNTGLLSLLLAAQQRAGIRAQSRLPTGHSHSC